LDVANIRDLKRTSYKLARAGAAAVMVLKGIILLAAIYVVFIFGFKALI
jgi:hypothetical protein